MIEMAISIILRLFLYWIVVGDGVKGKSGFEGFKNGVFNEFLNWIEQAQLSTHPLVRGDLFNWIDSSARARGRLGKNYIHNL